jgi:hypothetical protein
MIVCPSCRTVNEEDLPFCAKCGRTLEPGPVMLAPRRTDLAERVQLELKAPPKRSKWKPVVVLGTMGLMLIGGGAFFLFRPDPCKGTNFTSDTFGYCLSVPEGWVAQPARFGTSATLDQFAPPRATATVIVDAADLTDAAQLDQWAAFVRQKDQDAGLIPGRPTDLTLDGVAAQQWDVSVTSDSGAGYTMREVVVVRDDVGWRVTLSDSSDGFASSAGTLKLMLESWRFR